MMYGLTQQRLDLLGLNEAFMQRLIDAGVWGPGNDVDSLRAAFTYTSLLGVSASQANELPATAAQDEETILLSVVVEQAASMVAHQLLATLEIALGLGPDEDSP